MSKVTIVSSSMRKGNSDILCDEFQRGLQENKNEIIRINIRDKKINFCRGCSLCQTMGECSLQDDMKEIIKIIKATNVLVLATPIYFGEICGQLKTFLDRLYPLYGDFGIKKVIIIASCYQDSKKHIDESLNSLKRFFKDMGDIEISKIIYGENCDDIGDVSEAQKEIAYLCGKDIR